MKIKQAMLLLMLSLLISSAAMASSSDKNGKIKETGYNFGESSSDQSGSQSNSEYKVNIKSSSFEPYALAVPIGATVEWHNQDGVQHRIVSSTWGLFDSGVINPGKKYFHKFDNVGTYEYYCSIHPEMQGKIIVTDTTPMQVSPSWSESVISTSSKKAILVSTGAYLDDNSETSSAASSTTSSSASSKTSSSTSSSQSAGSGTQASGSGGSSYAQSSQTTTSSQSSLMKYSQYYTSADGQFEEQITSPEKIELNDVQPDTVYFGTDQKSVSYNQYQTNYLSTGGNWLWISGTDSWTQYAMVPMGSILRMIMITPSGGSGNLYEIYPSGSLGTSSFYFYAYNELDFYADEAGQHLLFFNIDGQPSNVIVIEVLPSVTYLETASYATISVKSEWLRDYNVYVDGILAATEGMTGEPAGTVTVSVLGDQSHNIAVDASETTFSDYKYFRAGYAYQLNV